MKKKILILTQKKLEDKSYRIQKEVKNRKNKFKSCKKYKYNQLFI